MKIIKISLSIESGTFRVLFNKLKGQEENFNSLGVDRLKKLFSNERARILYTIRTKKPKSIYQLTKFLGRDFGSVRKDTRLLERFGFIYLNSMDEGKRKILKPVLAADRVIITITL